MRQELRQQIQVAAPIFVSKEDRLPVIPALRNVMRSSWNNRALSPWHQQLSALKPQLLSVPEVFDPVFSTPNLPIVAPYIAISAVPAGWSLADEFFSPSAL